MKALQHAQELGFEDLRPWFNAKVGEPLTIHVTHKTGTVGFLNGPIDTVMGFQSSHESGLLIDGATGAWTLQLAKPEFLSATLSLIPDSSTANQLTIRMRNHWLSIAPGIATDARPGP